MAKKFVAYDIVYDTDDEVVTGLPKSVTIHARNMRAAQLYGADQISDKTGWCVTKFKLKKGQD
jgi:hypothetical protein